MLGSGYLCVSIILSTLYTLTVKHFKLRQLTSAVINLA